MVDIAVNMGLFRALNETVPSNAADLAKRCNADPILTGS